MDLSILVQMGKQSFLRFITTEILLRVKVIGTNHLTAIGDLEKLLMLLFCRAIWLNALALPMPMPMPSDCRADLDISGAHTSILLMVYCEVSIGRAAIRALTSLHVLLVDRSSCLVDKRANFSLTYGLLIAQRHFTHARSPAHFRLVWVVEILLLHH